MYVCPACVYIHIYVCIYITYQVLHVQPLAARVLAPPGSVVGKDVRFRSPAVEADGVAFIKSLVFSRKETLLIYDMSLGHSQQLLLQLKQARNFQGKGAAATKNEH